MTIPLHPMLVHLPIALALLMPLFTLALLLAIQKGWAAKTATWIALLSLQTLLVISCYLAVTTGEREEDAVELVVAESVIEVHEERAETFLAVAIGVWLLTAITAVVSRRKTNTGLCAACMIGTIAVAVLAMWTGKAGGELVYRYRAADAYNQEPERPRLATQVVDRSPSTQGRDLDHATD